MRHLLTEKLSVGPQQAMMREILARPQSYTSAIINRVNSNDGIRVRERYLTWSAIMPQPVEQCVI